MLACADMPGVRRSLQARARDGGYLSLSHCLCLSRMQGACFSTRWDAASKQTAQGFNHQLPAGSFRCTPLPSLALEDSGACDSAGAGEQAREEEEQGQDACRRSTTPGYLSEGVHHLSVSLCDRHGNDVSARDVVSVSVSVNRPASGSSMSVAVAALTQSHEREARGEDDLAHDLAQPQKERGEEGARRRRHREGGAEGSGVLWDWMQGYARAHAASRRSRRWCSNEDSLEQWTRGECLRALVYTCPVGADGEAVWQCGGLADRMKGVMTVLLLALLSSRTFFIDLRVPVSLQDFLAPNAIDWRLDNVALVLQQPLSKSGAPRDGGRGTWWGGQEGLLYGARVDMIYFATECSTVMRDVERLLDPNSEEPGLVVASNQALFACLTRNHTLMHALHMREAGLLGAFPSPHPHLFRFLFRLHPTMARFATETLASQLPQDLARRLLASDLFQHLLPSEAGSERLRRRRGGGGGNSEHAGVVADFDDVAGSSTDNNTDIHDVGRHYQRQATDQAIHVLAVQLRFGGHFAYAQPWQDPNILDPQDLRRAAKCLEAFLERQAVPMPRVRVLVVADHHRARHDFIRKPSCTSLFVRSPASYLCLYRGLAACLLEQVSCKRLRSVPSVLSLQAYTAPIESGASRNTASMQHLYICSVTSKITIQCQLAAMQEWRRLAWRGWIRPS